MQVEDILKLLLVALFLLPGLFGKKKKKTEPAPNPEPLEYEDPFKDFRTFDREDEFEEDDFEEASPQVVKDSYDLTPEQEGTSVFTPAQVEAALAIIAEQTVQDNTISQDEIKNEETNIDKGDENDFIADFNVRQALIYSEILKPKYVQ
jgi:hypothetical protein